ncbi:MAG: hypothetical protein ACLRPT_01275 [Akkermansia muciniphila]
MQTPWSDRVRPDVGTHKIITSDKRDPSCSPCTATSARTCPGPELNLSGYFSYGVDHSQNARAAPARRPVRQLDDNVYAFGLLAD